MYYRLKNSMIALAVSVGLLFALGFAGAPVPAAPHQAQRLVTSDLLRLANEVPVSDDTERTAWVVAAAVAGMAIEAGLAHRHNALAKESVTRRRVIDRRLRMPFYSFASQAGRSQES